MKNLIAAIFVAGTIQTGYAQMIPGEKEQGCAKELMAELSDCLTAKNIEFQLETNPDGSVTINPAGNPPPGHIQSCIAHYNQRKRSCNEAPVLINGAGK